MEKIIRNKSIRHLANDIKLSSSQVFEILNGQRTCSLETMNKLKNEIPNLKFEEVIKIKYRVKKEKENN